MSDVPSERRFRVALSFPSEKRAFVKNVANRLAAKFDKSKVLFDEWYEAEFARVDLGTYLPELYRTEADLIVVFHCTDYVAKTWCGAEWRAIHSLIHQKKPEAVMLCRFDFGDVPGIYETAGYVDIKEESDSRAGQVADLVLQRLDALNPSAIDIPSGDFVYVSECAGDLEGVHYRFVNDLRSELEPLNVQVIAPEFRRSPEAKDSIPQLLKAARFVIQLHSGSSVPVLDPAYEPGIEYFLIEQLRECSDKVPGTSWLRWRSDGLVEEQIPDDAQRAIVFDENSEVKALPALKFRELVVDTVRRELEREQMPEISDVEVLVRTTDNGGAATGDLCDRVDLYTSGDDQYPLRSRVLLAGTSLKTCCDEYRARSLRPGGLFVVHEEATDENASEAENWVQQAMEECRTVALSYRPTLPVCLVYATESETGAPRLKSVPGRFRVINYRSPDRDPDASGPTEPDKLQAVLKKVEQVQR